MDGAGSVPSVWPTAPAAELEQLLFIGVLGKLGEQGAFLFLYVLGHVSDQPVHQHSEALLRRVRRFASRAAGGSSDGRAAPMLGRGMFP